MVVLRRPRHHVPYAGPRVQRDAQTLHHNAFALARARPRPRAAARAAMRGARARLCTGWGYPGPSVRCARAGCSGCLNSSSQLVPAGPVTSVRVLVDAVSMSTPAPVPAQTSAAQPRGSSAAHTAITPERSSRPPSAHRWPTSPPPSHPRRRRTQRDTHVSERTIRVGHVRSLGAAIHIVAPVVPTYPPTAMSGYI